MGERFPKLPVIWIESGLAWVPFLMQRLDHEYMMRPSEAPLLKKKPSDYMRDMYYSSQPMEIQDRQALECTFRMINAETQLLYSSDYPHWDFDLPTTIYDLPFLSEKAKHNILGGTAARLFKLPPRNEKQKENLEKFGNLARLSAITRRRTSRLPERSGRRFLLRMRRRSDPSRRRGRYPCRSMAAVKTGAFCARTPALAARTGRSLAAACRQTHEIL